MATITVLPQRSELASILRQQLERRRIPPQRSAVISVALQRPNSLLHDGHAWARHTRAQLLSRTRDALAAARRNRAFLVHASYAFLRAAEDGTVGDRLTGIVEAALDAEQLVLGAPAACVVRLGYLYGPESRDLRAYRRAFRLGRPYWAGPASHLQHHLHTQDAARALLLAAQRASAGQLCYATDATPASFQAFMDAFARRVGNPLPLHLPRLSRPLSRLVVAEDHMQMLEMRVHGHASPRLPGFRPQYLDFGAGIDQVMDEWGAH